MRSIFANKDLPSYHSSDSSGNSSSAGELQKSRSGGSTTMADDATTRTAASSVTGAPSSTATTTEDDIDEWMDSPEGYKATANYNLGAIPELSDSDSDSPIVLRSVTEQTRAQIADTSVGRAQPRSRFALPNMGFRKAMEDMKRKGQEIANRMNQGQTDDDEDESSKNRNEGLKRQGSLWSQPLQKGSDHDSTSGRGGRESADGNMSDGGGYDSNEEDEQPRAPVVQSVSPDLPPGYLDQYMNDDHDNGNGKPGKSTDGDASNSSNEQQRLDTQSLQSGVTQQISNRSGRNMSGSEDDDEDAEDDDEYERGRAAYRQPYGDNNETFRERGGYTQSLTGNDGDDDDDDDEDDEPPRGASRKGKSPRHCGSDNQNRRPSKIEPIQEVHSDDDDNDDDDDDDGKVILGVGKWMESGRKSNSTHDGRDDMSTDASQSEASISADELLAMIHSQNASQTGTSGTTSANDSTTTGGPASQENSGEVTALGTAPPPESPSPSMNQGLLGGFLNQDKPTEDSANFDDKSYGTYGTYGTSMSELQRAGNPTNHMARYEASFAQSTAHLGELNPDEITAKERRPWRKQAGLRRGSLGGGSPNDAGSAPPPAPPPETVQTNKRGHRHSRDGGGGGGGRRQPHHNNKISLLGTMDEAEESDASDEMFDLPSGFDDLERNNKNVATNFFDAWSTKGGEPQTTKRNDHDNDDDSEDEDEEELGPLPPKIAPTKKRSHRSSSKSKKRGHGSGDSAEHPHHSPLRTLSSSSSRSSKSSKKKSSKDHHHRVDDESGRGGEKDYSAMFGAMMTGDAEPPSPSVVQSPKRKPSKSSKSSKRSTIASHQHDSSNNMSVGTKNSVQSSVQQSLDGSEKSNGSGSNNNNTHRPKKKSSKRSSTSGSGVGTMSPKRRGSPEVVDETMDESRDSSTRRKNSSRKSSKHRDEDDIVNETSGKHKTKRNKKKGQSKNNKEDKIDDFANFDSQPMSVFEDSSERKSEGKSDSLLDRLEKQSKAAAVSNPSEKLQDGWVASRGSNTMMRMNSQARLSTRASSSSSSETSALLGGGNKPVLERVNSQRIPGGFGFGAGNPVNPGRPMRRLSGDHRKPASMETAPRVGGGGGGGLFGGFRKNNLHHQELPFDPPTPPSPMDDFKKKEEQRNLSWNKLDFPSMNEEEKPSRGRGRDTKTKNRGRRRSASPGNKGDRGRGGEKEKRRSSSLPRTVGASQLDFFSEQVSNSSSLSGSKKKKSSSSNTKTKTKSKTTTEVDEFGFSVSTANRGKIRRSFSNPDLSSDDGLDFDVLVNRSKAKHGKGEGHDSSNLRRSKTDGGDSHGNKTSKSSSRSKRKQQSKGHHSHHFDDSMGRTSNSGRTSLGDESVGRRSVDRPRKSKKAGRRMSL